MHMSFGGLGSFARVSGDQMVLFVCIMLCWLSLSFLLIKTMNLLLLGDGYARNLGLNIKRARLPGYLMLRRAGGYCNGLLRSDYVYRIGGSPSVPCHLHSSDHRVLMPATLLVGASLALVCNLIARMPGFEGALPVNSVTALVGAPVVASVLFRKRKGGVRLWLSYLRESILKLAATNVVLMSGNWRRRRW